jgi:hypothetical protein
MDVEERKRRVSIRSWNKQYHVVVDSNSEPKAARAGGNLPSNSVNEQLELVRSIFFQ